MESELRKAVEHVQQFGKELAGTYIYGNYPLNVARYMRDRLIEELAQLHFALAATEAEPVADEP